MTDYQKLLNEYKTAVLKALGYLKYSFKKVQSLSMDLDNADPELLETWESFVARFARVTDIFLMKYIRARAKVDDPAFEGSFIDHLNKAEKLGLIEDAHFWMEIRKIRNQAAHEYTPQELAPYLKQLKELTPAVLAIEKVL